MCGIFLSISCHGYISPNASTRRLLQHRGPDQAHEHQLIIQGSASSQKLYLTFFSTVLSLRGADVVGQPLIHARSHSILCWNGEAWKIGSDHIDGNDSERILALLVEASSVSPEELDLIPEQRILTAISSISGPFALVFYDAPRRSVYYGRDCLGRRSLLKRTDTAEDLILSSVCSTELREQWHEVEADGIYAVDVHDGAFLPGAEVTGLHSRHIPFLQEDDGKDRVDCLVLPFSSLNKTMASSSVPKLGLESDPVSRLHDMLHASIDLRVRNVRQAHDLPDSMSDTKIAILFSGGLDCTVLARIAHDILPLAESIDLLNVAFQNPRIHRTKGSGPVASPYELCPDRITGRRSFAELQVVCPDRHWRFVEIDIPYTETTAHRDTVIELMHPHNTEMDLSISYALYFASRGSGVVRENHDSMPVNYTTPAHVLLSGLGADELFGGYQRHATAFSRHGLQGLVDELDLDISRLGKRNLGRDDRVISNWGREVRFPYLDESLLAWALACPVWEKCGFGESVDKDASDPVSGIEPSKKVLRVLAWKLGMHNVATEKKRAVSHYPSMVNFQVYTDTIYRSNSVLAPPKWKPGNRRERIY